MASKFSITIYTELDTSTNIHLNNDRRIIFKQCGEGIYYFDTTNDDFSEEQTAEYTFLNTVDSNNSCFHRQYIKGSDEERVLQKLVGWPSTSIQKNQIRNFLITTYDIIIAEPIYGPQIPIIQDKGNKKDTLAPQDHPKDTLSPCYDQTPPKI